MKMSTSESLAAYFRRCSGWKGSKVYEVTEDTKVMQGSILALTDMAVLPISAVLNAIKLIKNEGVEQFDPLIITQASLLNLVRVVQQKGLAELPRDSSSVDVIIFICTSSEFPGDQLFGEISRVLRPGGTVLLHQRFKSATGKMFERKLLVAGFLDVQIFPVKPVSQSEALDSLGVSFPSHSFLFLGPGETDTNKFLNA
ncbi:hypothetical protein RHGRI_010241 [Rhododendron griersonianum]|uniref:Methyltransferase type 11 domain-containing protein n=1 Tax=Rhododendron griersonianum TaxID=479676 RepID=A0AAV6KIF1_9ERIC|nr:hypothetical protein RHGRI_010241 [Rhododendron griersonianum]